jgi:hypothetical protein
MNALWSSLVLQYVYWVKTLDQKYSLPKCNVSTGKMYLHTIARFQKRGIKGGHVVEYKYKMSA